jgi:hypothetical protein
VPCADRGSRIGSGTSTITVSAHITPTAPHQACNMGNRHCSASSAKGHTMARCANVEWTPVHLQNRTAAAPVKVIFWNNCAGKKDVGPTSRFDASPEVGPRPLSVPCRPGTSAYKLRSKERCRTCGHVLPCVPRYRAWSPRSRGLRWCHVLTAPDSLTPSPLLGRAPVPPCVPRPCVGRE